MDPTILNPRLLWNNPDEYDSYAAELADLFIDNFNTFGGSVSYLLHAGPKKQNEIAI